MITYNHEPYIAEAIEGVLMQQTMFPFELIISEDFGTDNARIIVREYAKKYPNIIVVDLPEKNRGMINNFHYCISLAQGKYIAFCEGDDYWTDPLKLQKQVDFLEANPDYSMCYTRVRTYSQERNFYKELPCTERKNIKELIVFGNPISTLTVVITKSKLIEYFDNIDCFPESKRWKMGDYPIWIYAYGTSKVYLLNETTATYRILPNSASHFSNDFFSEFQFEYSALQAKLFFANFFNLQLEAEICKRCIYSLGLKYYKRIDNKYLGNMLRVLPSNDIKSTIIIHLIPHFYLMKALDLLRNLWRSLKKVRCKIKQKFFKNVLKYNSEV